MKLIFEENNVFKWIVVVTIALIISAVLGIIQGNKPLKTNGQQDFNAEKIKSMHIKTVSSDIEFIYSKDNDIKVKLYKNGKLGFIGKMPELVTDTKNSELKIEVKHKKKNTYFWKKQS